MDFVPHGKHLVAGKWVSGERVFSSSTISGNTYRFSVGEVSHVNAACEAAEEAFWSFGYSTREARAAFLDAIADEIDNRAETITAIGAQETGLPEARLNGERIRTTEQLRLFASHIRKGDYLDRRHDVALNERKPVPRPELKMIERPVGPVAVFGASNFPLAFSTAGGDTAAALAAGCPVVVKGHSAHPATSEIVAHAIDAARKSLDLHPGVFSLIQGGTRDVGHALVTAVGFTGSAVGGRALFDLCAARPEPIPFFGELGSVNPVFVLAQAAESRSAQIASGWAMALCLGAGQFCTNPGMLVIFECSAGDRLAAAAKEALTSVNAQIMLTDGIAAAYRKGRDRLAENENTQVLLNMACEGRYTSPSLFETSGERWLNDHSLGEEVFGPLGLIVRVKDETEMLAVARKLNGQLTCTIHLDDTDSAFASRLMPILERKAGRILANGYPTGVEVSDAMVHGGPYPASTNFGATSVGTLSIRRFLRPVCYQSIPDALLPTDLRES
jgi:alpha-ketoglutaric semialdehyde dehydrogenase